jgi:hypothetical protein
MKAWRLGLLAVAAAGFAWNAGCTKLTYEHWKTLTLQSTKPEVEAVLGNDHVAWRKADSWMYHDPDRQVSVSLEFANGDKVSYSRWSDPQHGMEELGKAAIEGPVLKERETRKSDINVP